MKLSGHRIGFGWNGRVVLASVLFFLGCAPALRAQDDGSGNVQFTTNAVTVDQSAGVVNLTVVNTDQAACPITVEFATQDGTATAPLMYTANTGTLAFGPGGCQITSQQIQITLGTGTPPGTSTYFTVVLSNLVNAPYGANSTVTVTITNAGSPPPPPPPPPTVQFSSPTYSVNETDGSVLITVTLSAIPTATVTVNYSTADGTALAGINYTETSGMLTFNPGDPNPNYPNPPSQTFTVPILNNGLPGPTTNFTVQPSAPTGATLGTPSTATVTIVDNNPPPLTVTFSPDPVRTHPGHSKAVTATVTPSSSAPAVSFVSADPTIATVSGNAPNLTVTGVVVGNTAIQAIYNGNVIASDNIFVVQKKPSISINFIGNKYAKQGPKAFIVYVNNFEVDTPQKLTHLDNIVNGTDDMNRLKKTQLQIKASGLPDGARVKLHVAALFPKANSKIRIFDDNNPPVGVIGPDKDGNVGGPGKALFEIPQARIVNGKLDLEYPVECVDHGNIEIHLDAYNAGGTHIAGDFVNAVMVVDRLPYPNKISLDHNARFRVRGMVDLDGVDGIEARMGTPTQPKLDWNNVSAPARTNSGSLLWVSAQTADKKFWMQTGLQVYQNPGATAMVPAIFIEVAGGQGAGKGYYRKAKEMPWPNTGVYKIAVTDKNTGRVEATLDGRLPDNIFFSKAFPAFKTQKMENYQVGTELFHSNDQNAGTKAKPCVISEGSVWVNGRKRDTAFDIGNVVIRDYDTRGEYFSTRTSHEWEISEKVDPRGFKMWDKVVEY